MLTKIRRIKSLGTRAWFFLRENWGAPFVGAFILLLAIVAVSFSIGLSSFADALAVFAYFSLVVGVVLQGASFLWYRRRSRVREARGSAVETKC